MTHLGTVPLETERMELRMLRPSDARDYACVGREAGFEPGEAAVIAGADEVNRRIGRYSKRYYDWAIVEKSSQRLAGEILTVNNNDRMLS